MLPDPLRLQLGGLQPQQFQVYEDFVRERALQLDVPAERKNGFFPDSALDSSANIAFEAATNAQMTNDIPAADRMPILLSELEKLVAVAVQSDSSLARLPNESDIRLLMEQVLLIAESAMHRDETVLVCSQRVVQLMYRSDTTLARDVFVILLKRLCTISAKALKEVTAWLLYAEDDRKLNVPVTFALVQAGLIVASDLDIQLSKVMKREYRPTVIDFTARLIDKCLHEGVPVASEDQFAEAIATIKEVAEAGSSTETSRRLLQALESTALHGPRPPVSKGDVDSSAVRDQLVFCFAEWVRLYQQSFAVEKSFVDFVVQLQSQGILKGEEISSLFFRVCAEVSVESYAKNVSVVNASSTSLFQPVDAFAKLIVFMIKYHADPTGANNDKAKIHYMTKVLSIVVLVLAQSHEELGDQFQPKPFFRFFSSLLSNLHTIEAHLGSAYHQILVALSQSLNTLQPLFFPGFAFSWVTLVSHRLFMPKLLAVKEREGWATFNGQLISLLRFLEPFLRRSDFTESSRTLYFGTLRLILVLLHDFPDFLSQAASSMCDAIPLSNIHLRNLVLSAFPQQPTFRLPDPLQPGLAVEYIPNASCIPLFLSDIAAALNTSDLRFTVDKCLQNGVSSIASTLIVEKFCITRSGTDNRYNVPLMQSLVLYLGVTALGADHGLGAPLAFKPNGPPGVLLLRLITECHGDARYHLIGTIVDQLRYPNAHTFWFSSFLLFVFSEASEEYIREQIARVLLERILVTRPHPWGILFTFARLLTGPSYHVLDRHFVKSVPEISTIFTQASSRMIPSTA